MLKHVPCGRAMKTRVRIAAPTTARKAKRYSMSSSTSGLSLFNIYVSLSCSPRCETIRLLRDFDGEMFLQAREAE